MTEEILAQIRRKCLRRFLKLKRNNFGGISNRLVLLWNLTILLEVVKILFEIGTDPANVIFKLKYREHS